MHVRVVLVGVEGSINLGFIARTCMNFSAEELYLVKPRADLEEAKRYAAKAVDMLDKAVVVDDLEDAISGVDLVVATTAKGYSRGDVLRQAIPIRSFVETLRGRDIRLAVLFGRESTGLTRSELEKADFLVTIPASSAYPVLNLSQAVAIVLWELWNIKRVAPSNIPPLADRRSIEELLDLIRKASTLVLGHEEKVRRVYEIWRKVLWRAMPSSYEVRLMYYWIQKVLSHLSR